jgi:hypothetical protein
MWSAPLQAEWAYLDASPFNPAGAGAPVRGPPAL